MRIRTLAILPLLGAVTIGVRPATAQISATIQFGTPAYGNEVRVYPYSAQNDGDWRSAYRNWQPVTLYTVNGRFYSRATPGARAVMVYRYNNQYFVPPRDAGFASVDRRYRNDYRPQDDDYNIIDRLAGILGQRPPRTYGSEVVVNNYAAEQFGDWRATYRRWTPVTLYYRDNHYYSRNVPGARAVSLYSWNGQYFLPPQDQGWNNSDRRFNYGRRPTADDYTGVQRYPGQYGQRDGQPGGRGNQPNTGYGNEIVVTAYSPTTYGEWRSAYNRWETVTLYNLNGKFYPNQVAGARQVMVYRSQNQYFLPPQDQGWNNTDRRYDYRMRPNDDDYRTARRPNP